MYHYHTPQCWVGGGARLGDRKTGSSVWARWNMNHSLSAPNRYTACRSHKKQVANINRIADKQVIASVSPDPACLHPYIASGASYSSALSRHNVHCLYLTQLHSTKPLLDSTQLYYTLPWLYTLLYLTSLDSITLYHGSTWLYLSVLHSTTALLGSTWLHSKSWVKIMHSFFSELDKWQKWFYRK